MRVIYKTKKVQKEIEYPNLDISIPVENINKAKLNGKHVDISKDSDEYIDLYFINEVIPVNDRPEQFDLIRLPDVLSNLTHEVYKHLKVCDRVWVLQEKSQAEILNNLNNTFGMWLDENYFPQTRTKHIIESLSTNTSTEKKESIKKLHDWLLACYAEKEKRELEYINNGIFPDFGNWPEKPIIIKNK